MYICPGKGIIARKVKFQHLKRSAKLSSKQTKEEFNQELVDTLQKIVNPKRLNRIYDKVIAYQQNDQSYQRQQVVLGVIQEYIREIDSYLQE